LENKYNELREAVVNGNSDAAKRLANELVAAGENAKKIIDTALVPAMDTVGDLFQKCEFFIPELLVAARAMEACLGILQPLLVESDAKPLGVAVIGTVKGDLHDIGKNILGAMLKGAGFEIVDLGVDVDPAKFVGEAEKRQADIMGLSALLTTTMRSMKDTIELLKTKGIRDKVKVMIGGAPITQEYADEIGADGFAPDAAGAVKKARQLIGV
jgi:5-methyltetrahydrofolate--homocysteine methyltransferase